MTTRAPPAPAAAHAAAERLRPDGKMRHVGQEGRDDDIAVLAVGGLPKQTSPYAGLTAAARLLAAIPDALRARAAEHAAENAEGGNADGENADGENAAGDASSGGYAVVTSAPVQVASGGGLGRSLSGARAEATMSRLATATAPERLMLAHYPGGEREGRGTFPTWITTPMIRAIARVSLVARVRPRGDGDPVPQSRMGGGARRVLRVTLEDGRGEADVAPSIGRLVLFDCRRILHEVRPSYAGRWAMTAWIND